MTVFLVYALFSITNFFYGSTRELDIMPLPLEYGVNRYYLKGWRASI
jgi:hypothetical protein